MIKIAVITESDNVWLLDVWEQTLSTLKNQGYDVCSIVETSAKLSNRKGIGIFLWYIRIFGLIDFVKLSLFAVNRLLRRRLFSPHNVNSIETLAKHLGVRYIKCKTPNDEKVVEWIKKSKIDIVLCSTSYIISKLTLQAPRLGFINKHAALLPSNKGLFPYFWAHLNGLPQGVSYHLMVEEIDKGPLLHQVEYPVTEDTGSMVNFYCYVFRLFSEHMGFAIKACLNEDFIHPPKNIKSSYFGLPTRQDVKKFRKNGGRIIDWSDIYKDRVIK